MANTSRRVGVNEMAGDDRRSLERLLGQALHEGQEVYILAFTPGVVPDEAARRHALGEMRQTFAKSEQHALQRGLTDEEIDEAVDEASDRIRYGNA